MWIASLSPASLDGFPLTRRTPWWQRSFPWWCDARPTWPFFPQLWQFISLHQQGEAEWTDLPHRRHRTWALELVVPSLCSPPAACSCWTSLDTISIVRLVRSEMVRSFFWIAPFFNPHTRMSLNESLRTSLNLQCSVNLHKAATNMMPDSPSNWLCPWNLNRCKMSCP